MSVWKHAAGLCQVCGFMDVLNKVNGMVKKHNEHRVGPQGPYVSEVVCEGSGNPPEPAEGPDLSGERFPAFRDVNQERWRA